MILIGSVLFKFFSSENVDGFIQDKIYKMATIDVGTKIYNKQYLYEALRGLLIRRQKAIKKTDLSLIYFDLDHFKKVNDTYGHNAGDFILLEIAKIIKKQLSEKHIFARFGGEEFIILLPGYKGQEAFNLAETVRKTCENYVFKLEYEKNKTISVDHQQTISLGVSQASNNQIS